MSSLERGSINERVDNFTYLGASTKNTKEEDTEEYKINYYIANTSVSLRVK